jgi:hypothetical protein
MIKPELGDLTTEHQQTLQQHLAFRDLGFKTTTLSVSASLPPFHFHAARHAQSSLRHTHLIFCLATKASTHLSSTSRLGNSAFFSFFFSEQVIFLYSQVLSCIGPVQYELVRTLRMSLGQYSIISQNGTI